MQSIGYYLVLNNRNISFLFAWNILLDDLNNIIFLSNIYLYSRILLTKSKTYKHMVEIA